MASGFLGGGPYLPFATTTTSMTLSDSNYTVQTSTAGITITLPPSNNSNIGRIYIVKVFALGEGSVTVAASGTDHIDSGTSSSMSGSQALAFQSNGNGTWYIIFGA